MKTIFSPRKNHFLKRVSFLLIAIVLVAAMVSCTPTPTYVLTMAVAPPGSGTATDETGTSPYARNTVVNIKAVANPCYQFVGWSAQAGQFGNSSAPETTFTMPAADVTVTANFEPVPADHYKLYWAEWGAAPPETFPADVQLVDQFGTFNATVGEAYWFGNPVKKVHNDEPTPIADDLRHYTLYELLYDEGWTPSSFQVTVNNQFTDEPLELTVWGPSFLAVPTKKGDQEMPECLDHLLVYDIWHPMEYVPEPIGEVDLYDQFHDELGVTVYEPLLFANPVQKTWGSEVSEIQTDEHYVFYPIDGEPFDMSIQIDNQFGEQTLDLWEAELLAVPSEKISWEQPLNHFKTYWADWALEPPEQWVPPPPADVQLVDQFVTINATVLAPFFFANPVEKWVSEFDVTPIWDPRDHLTLYWIEPWAAPQEWDVWVNNQFGNGQKLRVAGPWWLAVPTEKVPHGPTEDLNHYLVYEVYLQEYAPKEVYIRDQFFFEGAFTDVYGPAFLAVPAQKTHLPAGSPTPIVGDDHLLFYWIDGIEPLNMYNLLVINQFGDQYLDVEEDEVNFLGVPSQKTQWEGPYPYEPPD